MKLEKLKGLLVEIEQDELLKIDGGTPCCPLWPCWCGTPPNPPRPPFGGGC